MRNCDEFNVQSQDVERILDWVKNQELGVDIPFKPARVILQDFTYVSLFSFINKMILTLIIL